MTPTTMVPLPATTASSLTFATNTASLASQPELLEQIQTKPTNSLSELVILDSPKANAASQKPGSHGTLTRKPLPTSKSVAKTIQKRSRKTSAKTPSGWKRWAKKQKNDVYSEPEFQESSEAVDAYLNFALSWDEERKKPADISQQLPYTQFVAQWANVKKRGRPPPASMIEAIRIMNSLIIPYNIVYMLAKAGWDADKCCNPKLSQEQRKLGTGPTELKRGIEDEGEPLSQDKKQKETVAVGQQESSNAETVSSEIPATRDQSFRESPPIPDNNIVKVEEASPMSAVLRQADGLHATCIPCDEAEDVGSDDYSDRVSFEVDAELVTNTIEAAISNIQPAGITKSPEITKPTSSMNLSFGSANRIDASGSTSSKRKKRTSRGKLKRAIDAVSNNLTAISSSHSIKLQDQADRLQGYSEKSEDHSNQLQEHSNQLQEYAGQRQGHSNQLQKQELALTQLRHDKQALRDCLQGVLVPLSQAVNALHKSSKDDKRALKSAKKRAQRGLKEFNSVDKTTKVLKQSLKHLHCVLGAAEDRPGGNNEAHGQEK
ncbi:uncharacterized protein ColSpa_06237 [Colletotrichum spaethianum]|uniref:Uncharacterized protein n=1 Tax=Colletotrichum spaethianum TaxID=700344 RepID=A0AA37P6C3_9PEZI|nr:uncharacterized protein ColSpa_06237 [Colletotrichum spaethianum]GKT46056.1 hypothetical protein ColSpa_06237 [Colletotrichum spaethianum]